MSCCYEGIVAILGGFETKVQIKEASGLELYKRSVERA